MLIFNAVLLFVFDFYIFFALRATKIKIIHKKWFPFAWWGYSLLLFAGLFVAAKFNIPLSYRSIILVAFFMTAISKFIYILVVMMDDLRRGGVWVTRLFSSRKGKSPAERIDNLEKPLPENPTYGISRSEFLLKSGIVIASLPIIPLSWGIISGAYDYRIRRQKLVLPNLPQ